MEVLARAKGWIMFLGVLEIIGGALSLLGTFMGNVEGLLTGILGLISGVFLVGAASALRRDEETAAGENLRNYFVLQGVSILIAIILLIVGIVGIGFLSQARF